MMSPATNDLRTTKSAVIPGSHTSSARGREDGQTTSEYAVVLGMITVIIIGAWAALSGAIPNAISAVTSAI